MASVQEKLKLKRAPTDIWSIREQLCLASSVLKSGDQHWISVSRSLRPIVDKDSIRPQDWFSQKSCAQQYALLLENADIPKRKKRESGETTSESIVRRLTQDRISELSKTLVAQREEYQQLKNEVSLLKNGTISEEKLQKMWLVIEQEEKEQEQKNKAHLVWLQKQQQNKEPQSPQTSNIQTVQKKSDESEVQEIEETSIEEDEKRNKSERSSLLTSLLKSPSPTTQMQTQATGSPTIASLLCSSPKVPGPVMIQNVTPQLHQLVPNNVPALVQERPSATAPTLSMLLEQPSAGSQRALQEQLQNATTLINSKNLQRPMQVQNTIQTRSARLSHGNNMQITQTQQVIPNPDLSSEIHQIISNPIDEVMPKVLPMDKDEINEIIGDIEELIKEEITGSPQTLEPTTSTRPVEVIDNVNVQPPTLLVPERTELRNVDESVSLSNSPTSEISIEEIDSSTSNIAEIIGTAIEPVDSKINISNLPKNTKDVKDTKNDIQDSLLTTECDNKETVEIIVSEEIKMNLEITQESEKDSEHEINSINSRKDEIQSSEKVQFFTNQEECEQNKENEKISDDHVDCEAVVKQSSVNDSKNDNKDKSTECQEPAISEMISPSDKINVFSQEENIVKTENINDTLKDEEILNKSEEEKKKTENDLTIKNDECVASAEPEPTFVKTGSDEPDESINKIEPLKECENVKNESSKLEEEIKQDSKEVTQDANLKNKEEEKHAANNVFKELNATHCHSDENKSSDELNNMSSSCEVVIKKEKLEETINNEEMCENEILKVNEIKTEIKTESQKEVDNNEQDCKREKEELKKDLENVTIKKENLEPAGSVEELDEEEPTLSKLSGGRAMKTYSKKQNAAVDSEPENETGGETADYRAWKKSIMLVYNRLATHKYASIFLRPITEDQAPGYHSIIFRPMDLWTIKKNIDNGTIRSTTHFQRDVMLMFQNAIMFNKHNTLVHKMTLEMQEECLQHMQVLVRAAGEASFRRETRTAASNSSESSDSILKRKWSHITSSPHETESLRMKKRRKSEND